MCSPSSQHRIGAFFFAIIMLTTPTAFADDNQNIFHDKGLDRRWLLRIMGQRVTPCGMSSNVSTVGGKVDTPSVNTISFDLSYFVTDYWSIEMLGGPFKRDYKIVDSNVGSFDVGSISNFTISLGVVYHLFPHRSLSPYVGMGLNYAWVEKIEPAPSIPKFAVKDVTSGMFSVGADYTLNRKWILSCGIKYIVTPEYAFKGDGFESTVSMNTLITGVGLGYRF